MIVASARMSKAPCTPWPLSPLDISHHPSARTILTSRTHHSGRSGRCVQAGRMVPTSWCQIGSDASWQPEEIARDNDDADDTADNDVLMTVMTIMIMMMLMIIMMNNGDNDDNPDNDKDDHVTMLMMMMLLMITIMQMLLIMFCLSCQWSCFCQRLHEPQGSSCWLLNPHAC
jgi:hypothetical protein